MKSARALSTLSGSSAPSASSSWASRHGITMFTVAGVGAEESGLETQWSHSLTATKTGWHWVLAVESKSQFELLQSVEAHEEQSSCGPTCQQAAHFKLGALPFATLSEVRWWIGTNRLVFFLPVSWGNLDVTTFWTVIFILRLKMSQRYNSLTLSGLFSRRLDCHVAFHGVISEFIWRLTGTSVFGSADHALPLSSSSPVLPVYLTINARTRLDWRPCCSPQTWWEWCTPCIVSSCTVSRRSPLPRVRNPMALGSSRWLCKASVSSTVLPCLTYLPSRYS